MNQKLKRAANKESFRFEVGVGMKIFRGTRVRLMIVSV